MRTRAMSLHFILPLCFAVTAAPLHAQEGTFFSEFVEVTVTNVDVIVTDAAGRPVTGLERDDF